MFWRKHEFTTAPKRKKVLADRSIILPATLHSQLILLVTHLVVIIAIKTNNNIYLPKQYNIKFHEPKKEPKPININNPISTAGLHKTVNIPELYEISVW